MNEWRKRRIRYIVNNSVVGKLYFKLEGLIWLGICASICVIVFKFVFFLGF